MNCMILDKNELKKFEDAIRTHRAHPRTMPWRQLEFSRRSAEYEVLVSEFMLQQTQVSRVIPKFHEFLNSFPTIRSLCEAPLAKVLSHWSGLGYNRRAKYLHDAAIKLKDVDTPWQRQNLEACKGIGPNTAGAILAYAYNQPEPFIETNIRTVYIHHFFPHNSVVTDNQLLDALCKTIDVHEPRTFYWALMDYGTELKRTGNVQARKSKLYRKQSTFAGSRRQVRGKIIALLTENYRPVNELKHIVDDSRVESVVQDLMREGLVIVEDGNIRLP